MLDLGCGIRGLGLEKNEILVLVLLLVVLTTSQNVM